MRIGRLHAMHPPRLTIQRIAVIAIGLFLLVACQKAEMRYSATLDRASLMQLPFPGWKADGEGSVQPVDLSATAGKQSKADATQMRAKVTPLYVVRLDDTHAALLTQALPVDDDNTPQSCHACSGNIGAYFFEHGTAGWRLGARQDAVANSGVQGNIGQTQITKLADGHFALTAEWGSCWQGYCGSWLVLIGLQADRATLLHAGIPLSVDNDGAFGACGELDKPTTATADPDLHECLDVHSQWKIQDSRLLINFEGRVSKPDPDGKLLPTQKIAQQTAYAITPGLLTLVRGANPVPGF